MKDRSASLALGGGGLKGAAHIGVLKVLEEEKIPIGIIAGSSAGALVGGWYGLGYSAGELQELIFQYAKKPPLDFHIKPVRAMGIIIVSFFNMLKHGYLPTEKALIMGKQLDKYIEGFFKDVSFSDLRIPLMVTAVDLHSGRLQVFTTVKLAEQLNTIHDIDAHSDTDLVTAIRASIAIPGIFEPVYYKGMTLVDGGVKDLVPADLVRFVDARNIVAVDLGMSNQDDEKLNDLLAIIMQTIEVMGEELADMILERYADLILRPEVDGVTLTDFQLLPEIYQKGYDVAKRKLRGIKTLLRKDLF